MKNRVLALAGAVALIAVAVLVRQALAGDDDATGAGTDTPRVACTPELAEVCDALADVGAIATDPPTLTLADAGDPDATGDLDGWVTWDPAPGVADADATSPTWGPATPMGAAPVVVLASPETTAALADGCAGAPTWGCVAALDAAVGLGPVDTAEGLARIAPVAEATTEGEGIDGLDDRRLGQILDSPTNGPDGAQDSTEALVVRGSGAFDAVVVPAGLARAATGSAQGAELGTTEPTPAATMAVVVAGRGDTDVGAVADACDRPEVAAALEGAGVEPCLGTAAGGEVAGFLWQVRERVR